MNPLLALHPAALLRTRYRVCWWTVLVLLSVPALMLCREAAFGVLGPNPLETMERDSGRWALVCLGLTLSITPLRHVLVRLSIAAGLPDGRRLEDWNPLVRMRRMVGLCAFAYAVLHVGLYLDLDAGWEVTEVLRALREKPYVIAGAVAFLALVPLAVTSNQASMRALGRRWKTLHRLVYLAAIAACLHFVWMTKPGVLTPYPYVAVVGLLLAHRLAVLLRPVGDPVRDGGDEVPARVPSTRGRVSAARARQRTASAPAPAHARVPVPILSTPPTAKEKEHVA